MLHHALSMESRFAEGWPLLLVSDTTLGACAEFELQLKGEANVFSDVQTFKHSFFNVAISNRVYFFSKATGQTLMGVFPIRPGLRDRTGKAGSVYPNLTVWDTTPKL